MELQVPWLQGESPLYACSLRGAVKAFVEQHARRIVLPQWQYSATTAIYLADLVVPGAGRPSGANGGDAAGCGAAADAPSGATVVKLHIYEERSYGATVCDQCRCMGEQAPFIPHAACACAFGASPSNARVVEAVGPPCGSRVPQFVQQGSLIALLLPPSRPSPLTVGQASQLPVGVAARAPADADAARARRHVEPPPTHPPAHPP